mmetsp:Transcript_7180/g.10041  ORF Transcript_7180/g.10041 Transcript_7180/m.10041 type:complete len:107 (+) Transcript_7180:21-341(+)
MKVSLLCRQILLLILLVPHSVAQDGIDNEGIWSSDLSLPISSNLFPSSALPAFEASSAGVEDLSLSFAAADGASEAVSSLADSMSELLKEDLSEYVSRIWDHNHTV